MAISWVLEFMAQTLHKNHENWYPTKIKPSTVLFFALRFSYFTCVFLVTIPFIPYHILILILNFDSQTLFIIHYSLLFIYLCYLNLAAQGTMLSSHNSCCNILTSLPSRTPMFCRHSLFSIQLSIIWAQSNISKIISWKFNKIYRKWVKQILVHHPSLTKSPH